MNMKSAPEIKVLAGIMTNSEDEILEQNLSRLSNLSMEAEKKTTAEEILIKREKGMEMRKKGRLVKLRIRTKMTKLERDQKIRERLNKRITEEVAEQISNQWKVLQTGKGQKDQKEGDGIIKNLISLGLT